MAEYIDRKKIHFHAFFDAGDYSQAMRCINNMTPADVIERENVKNLIENAIEDGWELDYALERLKEI